MSTLVVALQHRPTRQWQIVGRLSHADDGYRFRYTRGAREFHGRYQTAPLMAFPRLDCEYLSIEPFQLIMGRVLSPRRPDFREFVAALGLPDTAEPMEILERSAGRCVTDNIELVALPVRTESGELELYFLAHGVRHLEGATERIEALKPGDPLRVVPQPESPGDDPDALLIVRADGPDEPGRSLGWVPRYLSPEITWLAERTAEPYLFVERATPSAPSSLRLLCKLHLPWPEGYVPFAREDAELLPIEASTG